MSAANSGVATKKRTDPTAGPLGEAVRAAVSYRRARDEASASATSLRVLLAECLAEPPIASQGGLADHLGGRLADGTRSGLEYVARVVATAAEGTACGLSDCAHVAVGMGVCYEHNRQWRQAGGVRCDSSGAPNISRS